MSDLPTLWVHYQYSVPISYVTIPHFIEGICDCSFGVLVTSGIMGVDLVEHRPHNASSRALALTTQLTPRYGTIQHC